MRSRIDRQAIGNKLRGPKKNKYGAQPTNGFPSKLEAAVYELLVDRERKCEITDIKRQQTVVLQEGSATTRIAWRVDFSFVEVATGVVVYAEAKGMATLDYILKLWRAKPPAPLEIYIGSYKRPKLLERIQP
jgi:hypothetical protein